MLSLFQPQRRSSLPVIQADLAAHLADLHELGLCLVDGGGGGVGGGCYSCQASEAKRELLEETLTAAHSDIHRKGQRIKVSCPRPFFSEIEAVSSGAHCSEITCS